MAQDAEKRAATRGLSYILVGFALVYLITSAVLDMSAGIREQQQLPPAGGTVGPIEVAEAGTVLEVEVSQYISKNRAWSFIVGELQDENNRYLTGFGDELWYETGYDSDGRWVESERDFEDKLTIRKPGKYYFKFTAESKDGTKQMPPIRVEIEQKLASSIPHFVGGILLLIIGVVMNIKGGGIFAGLFGDD